MSRIDQLLKTLQWNPLPIGLTRADLAASMGVSKPTVAALIKTARKSGAKIKTAKVRQGQRGPKALAYTLEGH